MWSEANSVPDSHETRSTSHTLKQVKSDNAIHSRGRLMADCLNAPSAWGRVAGHWPDRSTDRTIAEPLAPAVFQGTALPSRWALMGYDHH
jgi:hypothetical protein